MAKLGYEPREFGSQAFTCSLNDILPHKGKYPFPVYDHQINDHIFFLLSVKLTENKVQETHYFCLLISQLLPLKSLKPKFQMSECLPADVEKRGQQIKVWCHQAQIHFSLPDHSSLNFPFV